MACNRTTGLFVTGTDTGVGKTYVAAMIARALVAMGLRVGAYKPVASGCDWVDGKLVSSDAVTLWEAANRPGKLDDVCPQRFRPPLAPHLAAEATGQRIDVDLLHRGVEVWQSCSDLVIVEGAGGLMCPLGDDLYVADLALKLGYPLVVVARNALGTINHTLLTLDAARNWQTGLNVAGVVLNQTQPPSDDPSTATNRPELIRHCRAPILAEVAWRTAEFDHPVDWLKLAQSGQPDG
jgi:dethiobiotin synthetase